MACCKVGWECGGPGRVWSGSCPLDFWLLGDRVASQENLVACSLISPASSPASPQFTVVASPIGRPRHKAVGVSWQHGFFPLPLSCCPEVSGLISTGTSLLSLFSTSNIIASNPRGIGYPFWGGFYPRVWRACLSRNALA